MNEKTDFSNLIFIAGAAIILLYIIILVLTSAVIDPYLLATNRYVNYFDFYENNDKTNKIYFIGNSYTEYGVNASVIERELNYSYNVYNLGVGGDTPKHRIVELDSIIRSRPAIVFMDVTYGSFRNDDQFNYPQLESRFGLVTDKINLDSITKQLFNATELNCIQKNNLSLLAYKRQHLIPGIKLALANLLLSCNITNTAFLGASMPREFKYKFYDFPKLVVSNKTAEQFSKNDYYKLNGKDNINIKSFRHMVGTMVENGISVIIINMPLNPNYSVWFTNETKEYYYRIVKCSGCSYYDLEALCSPMEFRDHGHSNVFGQQNITRKMVEILKMEICNASQQH